MRSVFLKSVYVCGAAIAPKGLQILAQSEICPFWLRMRGMKNDTFRNSGVVLFSYLK
jgi:hypothetical protein